MCENVEEVNFTWFHVCHVLFQRVEIQIRMWEKSNRMWKYSILKWMSNFCEIVKIYIFVG